MADLVKHLRGAQNDYENMDSAIVDSDTIYITDEIDNCGRIYVGQNLVGRPAVWEYISSLVYTSNNNQIVEPAPNGFGDAVITRNTYIVRDE